MTILAPRTPGGRGLGLADEHRWDQRNNAHPAHELLMGKTMSRYAFAPRRSWTDYVFVPYGYDFADQGSLQECVGWGITQLLHVRSRVLGLVPIKASPGGIYLQARARRYGWDAIWDGGSNPHEAFSSIREVGLVRYEDWPHDIMNVNKTPPPAAYRKGADKSWFSYRWVLTGGEARTREVVALLSEGFPIGAALQVDEGLEAWGPGDEPWRRTGAILGGHYVAIVGYDTLANGRRVFVVANSWGNIHDHGFFLLSQEALESQETTYLATVDIDQGKTP